MYSVYIYIAQDAVYIRKYRSHLSYSMQNWLQKELGTLGTACSTPRKYPMSVHVFVHVCTLHLPLHTQQQVILDMPSASVITVFVPNDIALLSIRGAD